MKIECGKQKLKDAVVSAERITGKLLSLPVLRMVLLVATENTLKLRATNLDLGVEFIIPAKVHTEGVVAIPGELLGGYLGNLPEEKVITLELVNGNMSVASSKSVTMMKGYPYEDFPTIPIVDKGTPFTIEAKKFIDGVRSVIFSASHSDVKPEFNSVYCYTQEKDLVFVATDMSRLAEKRVTLKSDPNIQPFLIPFKNATQIIGLLEGRNEEITIVVSKTQVSFQGEGVYITSRLVDGVFPDYRQIFPKQKTSEVTILTEDLLRTMKLTGLFSGKQQQVLFKVYPEDKIFEVEAKKEDVGESVTRVDASIKGESVEMGFNYRYITDVLNVMPSDSIEMLFDEKSKTILIKPVPDTKFSYIVKYMRATE
jgi:DNA polymerase III subunit beta